MKASAGTQAVLCAQLRGLQETLSMQKQSLGTNIFSTSHV